MWRRSWQMARRGGVDWLEGGRRGNAPEGGSSKDDVLNVAHDHR